MIAPDVTASAVVATEQVEPTDAAGLTEQGTVNVNWKSWTVPALEPPPEPGGF